MFSRMCTKVFVKQIAKVPVDEHIEHSQQRAIPFQLDQAGYSVMEVMVGMGLSIIMLALLTKVRVNQMETNRNFQQVAAHAALTKEIEQLFQIRDFCDANLREKETDIDNINIEHPGIQFSSGFVLRNSDNNIIFEDNMDLPGGLLRAHTIRYYHRGYSESHHWADIQLKIEKAPPFIGRKVFDPTYIKVATKNRSLGFPNWKILYCRKGSEKGKAGETWVSQVLLSQLHIYHPFAGIDVGCDTLLRTNVSGTVNLNTVCSRWCRRYTLFSPDPNPNRPATAFLDGRSRGCMVGNPSPALDTARCLCSR